MTITNTNYVVININATTVLGLASVLVLVSSLNIVSPLNSKSEENLFYLNKSMSKSSIFVWYKYRKISFPTQ